MRQDIVLRDKIHTGHINFALSTLHRAIGQYLRYHSKFKVGITGKPKQRARRLAFDGWKEMVLIYSTMSEAYGRYSEYMLFKHDLLKKYPTQCLNRAGGGTGVRVGHKRYFIYILFS